MCMESKRYMPFSTLFLCSGFCRSEDSSIWVDRRPAGWQQWKHFRWWATVFRDAKDGRRSHLIVLLVPFRLSVYPSCNDRRSVGSWRLTFLHRRNDEKLRLTTAPMRCGNWCATTRPSWTREGEIVTGLQGTFPGETWRHRYILMFRRIDVFTVLCRDLRIRQISRTW